VPPKKKKIRREKWQRWANVGSTEVLSEILESSSLKEWWQHLQVTAAFTQSVIPWDAGNVSLSDHLWHDGGHDMTVSSKTSSKLTKKKTIGELHMTAWRQINKHILSNTKSGNPKQHEGILEGLKNKNAVFFCHDPLLQKNLFIVLITIIWFAFKKKITQIKLGRLKEPFFLPWDFTHWYVRKTHTLTNLIIRA
jgi:hypothetical protein